MFPLGQLILKRDRLPGQHRWHPVDEFADQCIGDVVDGEPAIRGLLGDPGVKKHL